MTPRRPEQFAEMRAESKSRIVLAALHEFVVCGYAGASMDKIAKRAQVSKGLIYHHFPSKDALLECVMLDTVQQLHQQYMEPLATLKPRAGMRAMIHLSLTPALWGETFEFFKNLAALIYQPELPASVRQKFVEFTQGMLEGFVQQMEAAGLGSNRERALLLAAQMDGIQMHYVTLGKLYPIEEMRNALLRTLRMRPLSAAEEQKLFGRSMSL